MVTLFMATTAFILGKIRFEIDSHRIALVPSSRLAAPIAGAIIFR